MSAQPDQSPTPAAGSEPALVLVTDAGTRTPAVPAGSSVAALDQDAVHRIKFLDAEAKALTRDAEAKLEEADDIRKQAAGLIVELLRDGASQRDVAKAIDRSAGHVSFASTAWFILQDERLGITSFNKAYKLAQQPAQLAAALEAAQRGPEAIEQPEPAGDAPPARAGNASAAAERPFPPWTKQMDVLRPLLPEMVEQADLRQARSLFRVLEKLARELHAKIQDLESVPGQA